MKVIAILPARLGSTRLPNKPLLEFDGKTMIRHTAERVLAAGLEHVVVATDSKDIFAECEKIAGVTPLMTSVDHTCGTERVLEAYELIQPKLGDFDLILNVQGDEPFIEPAMVTELLGELEKRQGKAEFFTTVTTVPEGDQEDLNVAKVVVNVEGNALIFTREPLKDAKKHTSVYIYSPAFLKLFCSLPPSPLELSYRLEQMRALDNNHNLQCIDLAYDAVSINDENDLKKAGVTEYKIWQK